MGNVKGGKGCFWWSLSGLNSYNIRLYSSYKRPYKKFKEDVVVNILVFEEDRTGFLQVHSVDERNCTIVPVRLYVIPSRCPRRADEHKQNKPQLRSQALRRLFLHYYTKTCYLIKNAESRSSWMQWIYNFITAFPFLFHVKIIPTIGTAHGKRYGTRNLGLSLHGKGFLSTGPTYFQLYSETAFCSHQGSLNRLWKYLLATFTISWP